MPSLNPYISFRDNARDALEFYQSIFGGDLQLMDFSGYEVGQDPSENHLIMHGQLETPDGFVLMAADTPSSMPYTKPEGMSVSVSGDDEAVLTGYWNGLSADGTVTMPFEVPPWGGRFGMLTDKFGVNWMVAVNAAPPQ